VGEPADALCDMGGGLIVAATAAGLRTADLPHGVQSYPRHLEERVARALVAEPVAEAPS
jgi:hypothetical protein